VISREAIPMTKVMAAAKMKAPITSNRISDNDITHQEMRPSRPSRPGPVRTLASELVMLAKR
jgi:hypothetical protein